MASPDGHREIWEFTPRQREVIGRMLRGTSPQQIAFRLGLGVRTVYWHVENIYRLAGVHSVGEFFAWAHAHRECCSIGVVWDAPWRTAV